MWSRQEEKRAMKSLNLWYQLQTTEKKLNQMIMNNVDVTYKNIEIQFPAIDEREKARIMSLYQNGAPCNE